MFNSLEIENHNLEVNNEQENPPFLKYKGKICMGIILCLDFQMWFTYSKANNPIIK